MLQQELMNEELHEDSTQQVPKLQIFSPVYKILLDLAVLSKKKTNFH